MAKQTGRPMTFVVEMSLALDGKCTRKAVREFVQRKFTELAEGVSVTGTAIVTRARVRKVDLD